MYITGHADSCAETSSKLPLKPHLYSHLNSCIPIGDAGEGSRSGGGVQKSELGGVSAGALRVLLRGLYTAELPCNGDSDEQESLEVLQ